jgi:hypothetical protein
MAGKADVVVSRSSAAWRQARGTPSRSIELRRCAWEALRRDAHRNARTRGELR